MDPASAIGLITSLVQLINATSKTLRYLNNVKKAPKSRAQVAQEASLLLALLTNLRYRVEDSDAGEPWVQGVLTLGMENGPLDQFKEVLESLARRLHGSGNGKSIGKALLWPFEKKEIDELLGKMERVKSFINLALQGDILNIAKSVKTDTTGIPVLHTNVLSVKDDVEKLRADQSSRDDTTDSIKADTAGIPVLQTDIVTVKNVLEEHRETGLAILEIDKRKRILAWISEDNARETYRRKLQERQPGTGNWFLESEAFQEWLAGGGKTLWCPGIPGAGKTILACVAMNELEERFEVDSTSVAACVFCDYKDIAATTPMNLISSLLSQILECQNCLPKCVLELYENQGAKTSKPSLEDMNKVLHELAKTQKIYLIVDALDECSDKDNGRSVLLQQLSSLQGAINILLTSRSSVSIAEHFNNYLTIEITAKSSDIDKYIAGHLGSRLQAHIKQGPSLYEEIRSVVNKRAQNMFLLVKLHMESLSSKQTPNAVRKALQTLPTGVFETYDDVLQRIEDQNADDRQLAKKTLMWLSLSLRPVTMRELQHAVTIDESFDELDEDDVPSEDIIVSVCAGLVNLTAEEGVAQLVHFTAQEYFSQESVQETLFFDGQRKMFSSCLTYLLLSECENGLPDIDIGPELDAFIAKHSLFYYAAHNWGHHARAASLDKTDQEMILRLLGNEHRVVSLIDALHMVPEESNRRFHPGILVEVDRHGLWLASYFGLVETVHHLLENGVSVNSCVALQTSVPNEDRYSYLSWREDGHVSSGRTAMTVAAWNGHVSVVRLLLDRGAKIQVLDVNGAVYNQHHEVVGLLLRHDASFHSRDQYGPQYYGTASSHIRSFSDPSLGYAPIHWCARLGNIELMRLLLANDADVELETTRHDTPLMLAAEYDRLGTVRLLLDHGIEVTAQDALKETACSKKLSNVHLLIEAGANVNAKNDRGQTPLFLATKHSEYGVRHSVSGKDTRQIVKLLQSQGANVDTCDNKGLTPLMSAAKDWDWELVRLLLDENADAGITDQHGQSVIHHVFSCDRFSSIQSRDDSPRAGLGLLRLHGVDFNTRDERGNTPLFSAVGSHLENVTDILDLLVELGADTSAVNNAGDTLLHTAVYNHSNNSSYRTVLWLLDTGISVDARNHFGETALLLAAGHKHIDVVELLVERGADITVHDKWGDTPLAKCADADISDEDTLEMLRTLIKLGAVVKNSPGHVGMLAHNVVRKSTEIFNLLTAEGMDVNTPDKYGSVPLLELSGQSTPHLVQRLLDAGARIDTTDSDGSTALHEAVRAGNYDNVLLLLSNGAKVAHLDNSGRTALHLAFLKNDRYMINYLTKQWIDQGNFDSVKQLLYMALNKGRFWIAEMICNAHNPEKYNINYLERLYRAATEGASESLLSLLRGSPLLGTAEEDHETFPAVLQQRVGDADRIWLTGLFHVAIRREHLEVLHTLINQELDVNGRDLLGYYPLHIATRLGREGILSVLLDSGAELEVEDRFGNTPLMLAAEAGNVEVVKTLIERGAKVSCTNYEGATVLHLTTALEVVKALISAGAGINAQDNRLRTPLHLQANSSSAFARFSFGAADQGLALVQCLLDAGANVNLKDANGNSPLHIACKARREMLKLMLKYNPDMTSTDNEGRTPLQIASFWYDCESAMIIREYLASS